MIYEQYVKFVNNEETFTTPSFYGKTHALLPSEDNNEQINEACGTIMESFSTCVRDGSGWVLDQVLRLDLCVMTYQPLMYQASSYISTPKEIAHPTKGSININNNDYRCF